MPKTATPDRGTSSDERRPPDLHRCEIADSLRERGLKVRENVGLSDFRIDLAVGRPTDDDWAVAVLLDGPGWATRSTVYDRDALPASVLHGAMGWRRVERVWFPMWLNPRDEVLAGIGRTVELALNPHYVDVLPEAKPPRPADPAAAEGPSAGWDHRWLQARGALGRYSGARGSLCRGRAHARESGASSGSATPSARATAFGRTGSTRPTPRDFPGFMPEFDVRQEVGETSCMALLHNAEVSAIQVDNGASVRLWLMDEALSVQAGRNLKRRELVNSQFQDVVLIDAETLEVGGLVFRIESPSDADEFMAAFHSRQTQKAESAAARSAALRELTEPFSTDDDRWQYLVVNTGAFNTASRLTDVLSATGRAGWELVTIYDKSSNWLAGIENGFMLLRRRVPPGIEPANWATQQ